VVGDAEFYSRLSRVVPHYYPCDKPEYHVALPRVVPGKIVLEVGCGEGCFGELLPAGCWFGVDINPDAIRLASRKGLRCCLWNFLEDDISMLPFRQYACICSFQMIEHLPDPGSFFEFASRHLAPEGRLILGAPAMDSLLGKQPMSMLNLPPHHQTWWTDQALRDFPESYGFRCEELIHAPLDFAHHRAYVTLLLKDLLAQRLMTLPPWLAGGLALLCSKPISLLTRLLVADGSIDPVFGARGQSVVAIYHKVGSPSQAPTDVLAV
jgi:SAM-dependent methyltransferase